jgi:hypothetical protein
MKYLIKPVCVLVVFFFVTAAVFTQEDGEAVLVNMQTIPMDKVETLSITSRADLLVLLESENSNVIVKEYRSENQARNKTQNGNYPVVSIINSGADPGYEITIESTTRIAPSPSGGRIEVYIPALYWGAFELTADGGLIRSEVNLDSGRQIDITVTNGDLELRRVSAERINIAVSSGSLTAEKLAGAEINLRHTSGPIEIGEALGMLSIEALSGPIVVRELTGGGSIVTQSGTIDIGLKDAMADLSCAIAKGNITITTPPELSYNLDAEVKDGKVMVTPPGGGSPINALSSIRWTFGEKADVTLLVRGETGSVIIGPGTDE